MQLDDRYATRLYEKAEAISAAGKGRRAFRKKAGYFSCRKEKSVRGRRTPECFESFSTEGVSTGTSIFLSTAAIGRLRLPIWVHLACHCGRLCGLRWSAMICSDVRIAQIKGRSPVASVKSETYASVWLCRHVEAGRGCTDLTNAELIGDVRDASLIYMCAISADGRI